MQCDVEHNLNELTGAGVYMGASGTTGELMSEINIQFVVSTKKTSQTTKL